MRIEYLDEVDSTNTYIRRYLEEGEDVIVCARRQTGGRGTKGRSFCSEEGGVYLSALTFYPDLPVSRAFRIMTHSAVAVCCTFMAGGTQYGYMFMPRRCCLRSMWEVRRRIYARSTDWNFSRSCC